jgi:undecaprenyl diphosphate synthase
MKVDELPQERIPKHVGLILDGNRRWARERGLAVVEGHRRGVERIEPVVRRCVELGVKHVTFWAFSTENWRRPHEFVSQVMDVFREVLKRPDLFKSLTKQGGQIHVIGDLSRFPKDIQKMTGAYLAKSKPEPKRIDVNFALNYGGRDEILRAVRKIIADDVSPDEIDEDLFSSYLDTGGQADVDLVIRTSGERRTSGFLPWQSVYAELYFPAVYWPDFSVEEFDKAILDFARRRRRYGGGE